MDFPESAHRPGGRQLARPKPGAADQPLCAFDALTGVSRAEWLSPEPLVLPEPLDPIAWRGMQRHAVIFAATAGFHNEFYALVVDAYVRDAEHSGRPRCQLLGVRDDWLGSDGTIRRAILFDAQHNRLLETHLAAPVRPDRTQFLSLGAQERERHRALSARVEGRQVNPWPPSALADDKAATLAGWTDLGLDVPPFQLIEPEDRMALRRFAARFPEVVLKPNMGTEGQEVSYLRRSDPGMDRLLTDRFERCRRRGAVIVQQRRDGVLYRDPQKGSCHTLALRLNVSFDGCRCRLTSGFAQIGAHADGPASCGRGGRIEPIHRVLSHLVARGDRSRPIPGPDAATWADLTEQAELAATLFDGLWLTGLDVLLDLAPGGRIVPVFLEANPRPAGLCRSRLLAGLPSSEDRAGLGLALWDALAAHAERRPADAFEAAGRSNNGGRVRIA